MSSASQEAAALVPVEELDAATVRFCGDSGDGMQLAGAQFGRVSVQMGNYVCSLTDYPAEIRAPAGSLAGVSGYQLQFSNSSSAAPSDRLDTLVAMNPAALQTNVRDLERGGILIVNSEAFTPSEWAKAGYERNPLDDGSLLDFRVLAIPVDSLNRDGLKKLKLSQKEIDRCKNFFVLGLVCWIYDRSLDPILKWFKSKFAGNPAALVGNTRALKEGFTFAATSELLPVRYRIPRAAQPTGAYRHLTGNEGLLLGLRAAARSAQRPLVFASAALAPASALLNQLFEDPAPDLRSIQAEDDVAAAGMALGASFAGAVGATATSGAGLGQMSEIIGLGVISELPLVVIDVQRGGPSTGLPTKTEQAELLSALFGRNGECPLPVLAPTSPVDCFAMTVEAVRLACRYMTPVLVLSDMFLSSAAEPWRARDSAELPKITTPVFADGPYLPYGRDAKLARPWPAAGTTGREYRTGGLEKEANTGNVSYDSANHEEMVRLRAEKIAGIAADIPELTVQGPADGELLVVGWGSTAALLAAAVRRVAKRGRVVAHAQFRYLNPLPRNTGDVLRRYRRVLVAELNRGQLRTLLRDRYLIDAMGFNRMMGRPFLVSEVEEKIESLLDRPPSSYHA